MSTETLETVTERDHVSVVVCGHVDAGKSTTTGHLLFALGGVDERAMQKLRDEAERLGKQSFHFAFFLDKQKEERERGLTISCTTKEFFTPSKHYTVIDAPGHRDFIKNMISGASQADVAMLMVPADGGFATSIAKGSHSRGEVMGQTRQHALLLNLLGVKQLVVCVNKMDRVACAEERFVEIRDEVRSMLAAVGFKRAFVEHGVPFLPISGFDGDNLIEPSARMPWWQGVDVAVDGQSEPVHVHTLLDFLEKAVQPPKRPVDAPLRVPISSLCAPKGVGKIVTGRVEQGLLKPGDEVMFVPTHGGDANPCTGKVFSIEMHRCAVPHAAPGDNVGICVRGLPKSNLPRAGDVMVRRTDVSLRRVQRFAATVRVLQHPGALRVGYTPIAFVRTARCACRLVRIVSRRGKQTGGVEEREPTQIVAGDVADVEFEPAQPLALEPFAACAGLGRVALLEGASVVMLGRVSRVIALDA